MSVAGGLLSPLLREALLIDSERKLNALMTVLKNSNFVDYPMCRSCILQHYFTIIGENCIIIIY